MGNPENLEAPNKGETSKGSGSSRDVSRNVGATAIKMTGGK